MRKLAIQQILAFQISDFRIGSYQMPPLAFNRAILKVLRDALSVKKSRSSMWILSINSTSHSPSL
jgi:hypothetical protein